MEFVAEPAVFACFPGIRIVVAVAHDLSNASPHPAIEAEWRAAWADASQEAIHGNAQSHPRIRPWRERFTAMGVSGKLFPSSAESLLRRALKGGEPFSINPLVDWYNSISLRHAVPAGGFDLSALFGPLELRLTREGDMFVALDEQEPVPVPPGEVAYADGTTILTRHFVWRQSRDGLITPATRDVILLSEVLGEVGDAVASTVESAFRAGLQDFFGVGSRSGIVDATHRTFSW
jgi:DNA/RNA-binding domain of Phe-tRNA-synthetase-like protein